MRLGPVDALPDVNAESPPRVIRRFIHPEIHVIDDDHIIVSKISEEMEQRYRLRLLLGMATTRSVGGNCQRVIVLCNKRQFPDQVDRHETFDELQIWKLLNDRCERNL